MKLMSRLLKIILAVFIILTSLACFKTTEEVKAGNNELTVGFHQGNLAYKSRLRSDKSYGDNYTYNASDFWHSWDYNGKYFTSGGEDKCMCQVVYATNMFQLGADTYDAISFTDEFCFSDNDVDSGIGFDNGYFDFHIGKEAGKKCRLDANILIFKDATFSQDDINKIAVHLWRKGTDYDLLKNFITKDVTEGGLGKKNISYPLDVNVLMAHTDLDNDEGVAYKNKYYNTTNSPINFIPQSKFYGELSNMFKDSFVNSKASGTIYAMKTKKKVAGVRQHLRKDGSYVEGRHHSGGSGDPCGSTSGNNSILGDNKQHDAHMVFIVANIKNGEFQFLYRLDTEATNKRNSELRSALDITIPDTIAVKYHGNGGTTSSSSLPDPYVEVYPKGGSYITVDLFDNRSEVDSDEGEGQVYFTKNGKEPDYWTKSDKTTKVGNVGQENVNLTIPNGATTIDLYAHYPGGGEYTVVYKQGSNGSPTTTTTTLYDKDGNYKVPNLSTIDGTTFKGKTGYTQFGGWAATSTGTTSLAEKTLSELKSNTTVYDSSTKTFTFFSIWKQPTTYDGIAYYKNGGTLKTGYSSDPVYVLGQNLETTNKYFNAPSSKPTWKGWGATASSTTPVSDAKNLTQTETKNGKTYKKAFAIWGTGGDWTIVYDGNGGNSGTSKSGLAETTTIGSQAPSMSNSNSELSFKGWYAKDSDGSIPESNIEATKGLLLSGSTTIQDMIDNDTYKNSILR